MLTPEEHAAFAHSADQVRQASERHLRAQRSQQSVIAFAANLQRGVSRVIQTAIDQGAGIACRAGCSHCCHARVEAMAPEIFLIARELARRPTDELRQSVQRLEHHAAIHSEATAWNQRAPCPFLIDDLCSIYEVRPSVCRRAHSLDVSKCQESSPEIPQRLDVVVGAEALAKGTAQAYGNLGYDASGHELAQAVLLALADPGAEFRWYSGESVFVGV